MSGSANPNKVLWVRSRSRNAAACCHLSSGISLRDVPSLRVSELA